MMTLEMWKTSKGHAVNVASRADPRNVRPSIGSDAQEAQGTLSVDTRLLDCVGRVRGQRRTGTPWGG